ncbi:unnamed protein product [Diatraea saccharalis]|uniref:PHD-type domain-containing protein n=1 Tax=Diatraea saccharalis TaxID=40085 RepID=A0A9N9WEX1_9NEOP|nr:unnamed protein product [Diatraea saccharalis]
MRTAGVDVAGMRKYECGACSTEYKLYRDLVCHLFWRHGTESQSCGKCPVRRWQYALHICNVLPYDDLVYGDEPDADVETATYSTSSSSSSAQAQVKFKLKLKLKLDSDSDSDSEQPRESIYCSCGREVPDAYMIGCDGDHCAYQWYHYTCVGITEAPDGKWFCPTCADR